MIYYDTKLHQIKKVAAVYAAVFFMQKITYLIVGGKV